MHSQLLQKDQHTRLGSSVADIEDVRRHAFFAELNWDDLMQRKVQPPFRPELSDAYDLRNIDPEFTREPVPASLLHQHQQQLLVGSGHYQRSLRAASSLGCRGDGDNVFAGFSYVPTTLSHS